MLDFLKIEIINILFGNLRIGFRKLGTLGAHFLKHSIYVFSLGISNFRIQLLLEKFTPKKSPVTLEAHPQVVSYSTKVLA